jgi:photosystem II stability/assembly factor-like uncharacterized protein
MIALFAVSGCLGSPAYPGDAGAGAGADADAFATTDQGSQIEAGASTGPDASPDNGADSSLSSITDAEVSAGDSSRSAKDAALAGCVTTPIGNAPALTPGQWTNISPPGLFRPHQSKPPYGCMDIHIRPCSPYVLYLTTDVEGMWKSTDGGSTWAKIGNLPTPISPGVIQIDPSNPQSMYYGGGVRGASLGFWVSADGGDTWTEPAGFAAHADNSVGGWVNDVYDVRADPMDFKHVLLTFHGPWEGKTDAGVLETMDGGNTWGRHVPSAAWGAGHSIFFLGNRSTWLLGTQANGFWRTADSGVTWTQVSTQAMQHGGVNTFYSKTGVLYVGALSQILRSTDNGLTFTMVGPHTQDGYYAVIGDGNFLYAQLGNTGDNSVGSQPYSVSMETDGITWTPYNGQTFEDGPYRMAFDSVNRIIYSANWNSGVWALKVN